MPCYKHERSEQAISGEKNSWVFLDRRTSSDTQLILAYIWRKRDSCACAGALTAAEKLAIPPNGEFRFKGKLRSPLDGFEPTGVCRENGQGDRDALFSRLVTLKDLVGNTPAEKIIEEADPYVCEDPG